MSATSAVPLILAMQHEREFQASFFSAKHVMTDAELLDWARARYGMEEGDPAYVAAKNHFNL